MNKHKVGVLVGLMGRWINEWKGKMDKNVARNN